MMRKRMLMLFLIGALALTLAVLFGAGQAAQSQGAPTPIQPTFGPVNIGSPVATWTPEPATATAMPAATATPPATATPAETASPTPVLPTLDRSRMGIQAYAYMEVANWWPMVDRMQFMGFGWIKAQVNWKEHEPEPGVFDAPFTVLRDNLVYAGRRGFKIMISVVNAPDWARPADARGNLDGPPEDPQALANFIGALLDNWGTEYVNAIEIWNEPNLIREWTGRPINGAEYKRYFDPAYAAIRARSSDIV
ncbi:MAG: cellulase family glycosylhydrolase, partial [Anaerolineae bacterium]|nr:cellulase family glycosylhydrolase [Anaerolineae bacterium]